MAHYQISPPEINVIDSRRAVAEPGEDTSMVSAGETVSIADIRLALFVFDSTTYSSEELDKMTMNDMVYAWRLCSGNEKSFSDYQVAQVSRTA